MSLCPYVLIHQKKTMNTSTPNISNKILSVEKIVSIITEYLESLKNLDFAFLFGSYVAGKPTVLSDVDIGIHTTPRLPLLDLGRIICDLEAILNTTVDVIRLNDIYRERPAFAMEIIKTGKLLVCRNENQLVYFKRLTYLFYMDTQPLREKANVQFLRRIESGRFGEHNYAG